MSWLLFLSIGSREDEEKIRGGEIFIRTASSEPPSAAAMKQEKRDVFFTQDHHHQQHNHRQENFHYSPSAATGGEWWGWWGWWWCSCVKKDFFLNNHHQMTMVILYESWGWFFPFFPSHLTFCQPWIMSLFSTLKQHSMSIRKKGMMMIMMMKVKFL